ncbi:hypothetical protein ACWWJF_10480 [Symbiopectobacterium sp. Eva_TO]
MLSWVKCSGTLILATTIAYFSDCGFASSLLEHASRLTQEEEALRIQLMAGNRQALTRQWLTLNTFAQRIENLLRENVTEKINGIDAACR